MWVKRKTLLVPSCSHFYPERTSDAFFGLFPRELSDGPPATRQEASQDDLAYEAEKIFRGMAHGADNVSNREPLQLGKPVGAPYLISNASPRRAASCFAPAEPFDITDINPLEQSNASNSGGSRTIDRLEHLG
jgi:hypothetical protein